MYGLDSEVANCVFAAALVYFVVQYISGSLLPAGATRLRFGTCSFLGLLPASSHSLNLRVFEYSARILFPFSCI